MRITPRMSREAYIAIDALNVSRLKEIKRSPLHYQHQLTSREAKSPALTLGIAAHVATLEPEKYSEMFCTWNRTTESGRQAPRAGQYWESFAAEAGKRTILTTAEDQAARAIARAVRFSDAANPYLETGEPEVVMEWTLPRELGGRRAKGRIDWLTTMSRDVIVGVKSARDCGPHWFPRHAFDLLYHVQWAWYFDGFKAIRGRDPSMVEIVVESEAPYAVAVYRIPPEIIELGRETYWELVKQLNECEETNTWPGPVDGVVDLQFPTWAYPKEDDLAGLDLEVA